MNCVMIRVRQRNFSVLSVRGSLQRRDTYRTVKDDLSIYLGNLRGSAVPSSRWGKALHCLVSWLDLSLKQPSSTIWTNVASALAMSNWTGILEIYSYRVSRCHSFATVLTVDRERLVERWGKPIVTMRYYPTIVTRRLRCDSVEDSQLASEQGWFHSLDRSPADCSAEWYHRYTNDYDVNLRYPMRDAVHFDLNVVLS